MAANIDQIIQVNISQQTQAVPQDGFGIPLIMGPSNRFSELVRYYTDSADMLADGFLTSDPEYIHAVEAFEQDLRPQEVGVGKYTVAVAQEDDVTVNTVVDSVVYSVTINSVVYSFNSGVGATQGSILAGLKAVIDAATLTFLATSIVSTTLKLIATAAGQGFTTTVTARLTLAHAVANHSIVTDIQALQDVSDIWYGLNIVSKLTPDIKQCAAYIESQKKIFIASSADAGILTSSATDIASILKGLAYKRTALLYLADPSTGPDAAWTGGQLPQVPGASTWKFKTLAGISPSDLTNTQSQNARGTSTVPGKNCNTYETVGGVGITREGFMVGGQFIDVTIGIDWLESTMQTNVFSSLVNLPKVPYTDQGASVIESAIRATLQTGADNGLIDASSITVSVPKVADVPANTRAQRILTPAKFSCRFTGAFHYIVINGIVTV